MAMRSFARGGIVLEAHLHMHMHLYLCPTLISPSAILKKGMVCPGSNIYTRTSELYDVYRTVLKKCSIAQEGKLTMEQKLCISTLCQRIGYGTTSQMVVQSVPVNQGEISHGSTVQTLEQDHDISQQIQEPSCQFELHQNLSCYFQICI